MEIQYALNVRPDVASDHHADQSRRNAVLLSEVAHDRRLHATSQGIPNRARVANSGRAYAQYVCLRELRTSVLGTDVPFGVTVLTAFRCAIGRVVGCRPEKQVRRVTAAAVVASVQNEEATRNRPVHNDACGAVRATAIAAPTERTVPSAIYAPQPVPALVGQSALHVHPETVGHGCGRASARTVHGAELWRVLGEGGRRKPSDELDAAPVTHTNCRYRHRNGE